MNFSIMGILYIEKVIIRTQKKSEKKMCAQRESDTHSKRQESYI